MVQAKKSDISYKEVTLGDILKGKIVPSGPNKFQVLYTSAMCIAIVNSILFTKTYSKIEHQPY